jgi:hypothetical protein
MALRWTAAAMHEAKKGFRRLKAYKQLRPCEPLLPLTTKRKQTNTLLPKPRRPLTSFTAAPASPSSTKHGATPTAKRINVWLASLCKDVMASALRLTAIAYTIRHGIAFKRGG